MIRQLCVQVDRETFTCKNMFLASWLCNCRSFYLKMQNTGWRHCKPMHKRFCDDSIYRTHTWRIEYTNDVIENNLAFISYTWQLCFPAGIDLAFIENGYIYHTKYDTADRILTDSIQRAGTYTRTQSLPFVAVAGNYTHGFLPKRIVGNFHANGNRRTVEK